MQLRSFVVVLATATTVLASPQGKGGPKGPKGPVGGGGSSGSCSPVEIVYARATMEAQGLGMVGGPLLNAAKRLVPGITAYAVRYPASGGDASPKAGVKDILAYFERQPKACPQQK
jgi:cutinase